MYQVVKSALLKNGELMIRVSEGTKFELHLHNVKFHDEEELIEIDAGHETYWISGREIVYFWIHRLRE
ncbi:MAG: hypothetical protein NZL96_01795 [Patescibacteria group bacterium]|nr:hypothetical protein [Patescibacteria group bacterium]